MALARDKAFQNTTVRLPREVYERAKLTIKRAKAASSFNEFVVHAIQEKMQRLTEAEIDRAFAQMADDPQYQRESVDLAKAFEKSDWEALQSTETGYERANIKDRTPKASSR
jgi:hypothetical protein